MSVGPSVRRYVGKKTTVRLWRFFLVQLARFKLARFAKVVSYAYWGTSTLKKKRVVNVGCRLRGSLEE